MPPEKESKELPGSSLVTSGHPTAPPASSAASALLNNDALKPAVPSCHDFFVRQNERGQLPQSAKDPGIADGFKQNRNVCSFSCSCLQLRRKPARNNLVNLQQLQVPVGDAQMHRSSASLLIHPAAVGDARHRSISADASSPRRASTRVTAPNTALKLLCNIPLGPELHSVTLQRWTTAKSVGARKLISSLLSDPKTFCQTS